MRRLNITDSRQHELPLSVPRTGIAIRFWSKVLKSPGCWEWIAAKQHSGYGKFYCKKRLRLAHRVAYEMVHHVTLPRSAAVLHKCDVRSCVRPNHLFLGTQKMNMADASQKGRLRFRRATGRKLWASSVRVLREMDAKKRFSLKELSSRLRMSPSSVSGLLTGRFWSWVGGPTRPRRKRLQAEEVLRLRELYAKGRSTSSLVKEFGIGSSQILRIVHGEDWPDLGGPLGARPPGRSRIVP